MNVTTIDEPNAVIKYRNPCLVMVGGVPGAGKTTLIERAIPRNAMLLSADTYRGRQQVLAGYPWDAYVPEAIPEARRKFLSDVHLMLNHRVPMFLDASYLTEHSQGEMAGLAEYHGIPAYLLIVEATLEQCLEGVSKRERTVPKELIKDFYLNYLTLRDHAVRDMWPVNLTGAAFVTRRASESLCIYV